MTTATAATLLRVGGASFDALDAFLKKANIMLTRCGQQSGWGSEYLSRGRRPTGRSA